MLKVTIDVHSFQNPIVREGVKDGRAWKMVSQEIWVHKPGQTFPEKFILDLPNGAFPYPAGDYLLDVESLLEQDRYKRFAVRTREVLLLPASAPAAAIPSSEEKKPLFGKVANA